MCCQKRRMHNYFPVLIIAIIALVSTAPASGKFWTDPDATDMEFGNFNQKNYAPGDPISFSLKIEHSRHREDFLGEGVQVLIVRKRFGRRDKKFQLTEVEISAADNKEKYDDLDAQPADNKEEDDELLLVKGRIPPIDKAGKYYILVRRDGSFGIKTIADSRGGFLKKHTINIKLNRNESQ